MNMTTHTRVAPSETNRRNRHRRCPMALIVLLSLLVGWTPLAQAAPANDDFAAATMLAGASGQVNGSNVDATKETDEPDHAGNGGGHSVWFQWTAPQDFSGSLTFDTSQANGSSRSDFDTLLAIYKATVDAGNTGFAAGYTLTAVGGNDDLLPGGKPSYTLSRAKFAVIAGATYFIAVDGYNGATGNIVLHWNPTPANDDFSAPGVLANSAGSLATATTGATRESAEPNTLAGTIWYQWTAPQRGKMTLLTTGSSLDTGIAVYSGNSLSTLELVAQSGGQFAYPGGVRFPVTLNTTYYIALDSTDPNRQGNVVFDYTFTPPPANDNLFDGAALISGDSGSVTGSNLAASKEPDEPAHADNVGGTSVWYKWVAPSNGSYTFETTGSQNVYGRLNTLLAIYTANNPDAPVVNALTLVKSNDDTSLALGSGHSSVTSRLKLNAVAGTKYYIAIDGYNGAEGDIVLTWNPTPANDDFANAQVLTGNSGAVAGTTAGSTWEPGGPNAADSSIWYQWTPTATGRVTFSVPGESSSSYYFAVFYTGSALANLNSKGAIASYGYSPDYEHEVRFTVTAGTTYFIQLFSLLGNETIASLNWAITSPPPNDNFAGALPLSGASGSQNGTTVGATEEAGEPHPSPSGDDCTVWYKWVAPGAGFYDLTLTDTTVYSTMVSVYTGDALDALTEIASHPISSTGDWPRIRFKATQGTSYYFLIDAGESEATFTLNWSQTPRPANDDLADAEALPSTLTGTVSGNNTGATHEAGEPGNHDNGSSNPYGETSVWYQWTAPQSGGVSFDLSGIGFYHLVGIYTGDAYGSLTHQDGDYDRRVYSAPERYVFRAEAGTTYRIAIDGVNGAEGAFTLSWASAQPNDNFAAAQPLSGASGSVAGSNLHATPEAGEPDGGHYSIWYKWTATGSGVLTLDTDGTAFSNVLSVYTGGSVDALTEIATNTGGGGGNISRLTFAPTTGTTYFISVRNYYVGYEVTYRGS